MVSKQRVIYGRSLNWQPFGVKIFIYGMSGSVIGWIGRDMGWNQQVIYGLSGRDVGYGLENMSWKQRSGRDMGYVEKVSNLWEEG